MAAASSGIGRWTEPVIATRAIHEGDTVDLGGEAWHVYHTPGHAGGLVCLWNPLRRVLLANDHLIRDISSNPVMEPPITNGPRPRRLVEYLTQLARMADLDPAIALPGHGEPVTDVAGLVRQRRAFHARRAQRILETLEDRPLTLWEVTQPVFPRLQRGMDYFLALSEVLGHLDLLEVDGRAATVADGGRLRWTRSGRAAPELTGHDHATA
jgi:glyoxylase-like metal-dependent hydrolase (beta-lactamase superfamily II)